MVVLALLLAGLLVLLIYVLHRAGGDRMCHTNDVGCGLGIHLVGTGLAALVVYYLVFLRREARAARRWRSLAKSEPEKLFETLPPLEGLTGEAQSNACLSRRPRDTGWRITRWYRRRRRGNLLLKSIVGRDQLVKELAADLEDVGEPRILVAASGSGKTMVLLKLAERLARRGQVPIPVSLRGTTKLDFERLARKAYGRYSEVHRDEELDHQWQWLRKRNRITILADELERSKVTPARRARAIDAAGAAGLRLVVTSRPDGLPADFRRGRINLDRLDREVVVGNLCDWVSANPLDRKRVRNEIEGLVDRAEVTDTPYYLATARVLAALDMLHEPPPGQDARLYLMESYREALEACRIRPDAGLKSCTRKRELERLEAVAWARLLGAHSENEISLRLKELAPGWEEELHDCVTAAIRLGVLNTHYGGRIRFGHSTSLAYFASCFLVKHREEELIRRSVSEQDRVTPMLSLALTFASAKARDHAFSEMIVRDILKRLNGTSSSTNGDRSNHPSRLGASAIESSGNGAQKASVPLSESEHLGLIATAADVVRSDPSPVAGVASRVVGSLTSVAARRDDVALAQKRAVYAVGKLGTDTAYEKLWSLAKTPGDYVLRRAAARTLNQAGSAAVESITPKIRDAIKDARLIREGDSSDQESRRRTEAAKAAAWILPSLRSAAHESNSKQLADLDEAQGSLVQIARDAIRNRGIESSVAQGLKSDALRHPGRSVDQIALDMIDDGELRATFWFSRVLALQAVTRRCIGSGPRDRDQRVGRDKAKKAVGTAKEDEHPFVRETARLCLRAISKNDWHRFQWDDVTDIAAGTPHKLVIDATRLVGDMVLALNLNEQGTRKTKQHFGESNKLPACLTTSPDRLELLGSEKPKECEFAIDGRCFCPYLYESPEDGVRRELSRVFCRHQRLTARQPPWQPGITVRELRQFWTDMEDLAQF